MPIYKNPDLVQIREGLIFNTLEWGEFVELLDKAIDEEHKALLIFTYLLGPRPTEVHNIDKSRIKIERNKIIIRIRTAKRGLERLLVIPVCNSETQFLKEYISMKFPKEYLFIELAKKRNPRDYFIFLNRKSGIGRQHKDKFVPFCFYFFRHNIATLLSINGLEERLLNYFQGKPLISTVFGTSRMYVHANLDYAMKVAKVLRKIMK